MNGTKTRRPQRNSSSRLVQMTQIHLVAQNNNSCSAAGGDASNSHSVVFSFPSLLFHLFIPLTYIMLRFFTSEYHSDTSPST